MNQITASNQLTGTQSEAMKQVMVVLEKKVRNMEKKKVPFSFSSLSRYVLPM